MDTSKTYKTSWTDNHLIQLSNPQNHRIRVDKVGFIWEHQLDGKWDLHSVFKYQEHRYYYQLIKFWTHKWSKELASRRNAACANFNNVKEIKNISDDRDLSIKEKFELVKDIVPNEPLSYIADSLNVSLSTLKRAIRLKKAA
ncbi:hypothetical protein OAD50_01440 [Vicingaceae bacterium]|nr:hypothetical protein [Vicingaceae bacterium]